MTRLLALGSESSDASWSLPVAGQRRGRRRDAQDLP